MKAKIAPKKVRLNLEGLDGNAFFLMGAFSRAARHQGWTEGQIEAVMDECQTGDYDHLLQTLIRNTTHEEDEGSEYTQH